MSEAPARDSAEQIARKKFWKKNYFWQFFGGRFSKILGSKKKMKTRAKVSEKVSEKSLSRVSEKSPIGDFFGGNGGRLF